MDLFEKVSVFLKLANMTHEQARNILGISPIATSADIHAAHKKLVFKHHPDRNPGADTTSLLSQINVARDTLGRPEGMGTIDLGDIDSDRRTVDNINNWVDNQEKQTDAWMDSLKIEREWSEYNMGDIPASALKYPENIAKAPEREAIREAYRLKKEKDKARRQAKKVK